MIEESLQRLVVAQIESAERKLEQCLDFLRGEMFTVPQDQYKSVGRREGGERFRESAPTDRIRQLPPRYVDLRILI